MRSVTIRVGWYTTLPAPLPVLQRDVLQHVVQAYNFVRSPMMMQPGSHLLVQFLSIDHVLNTEVEFSVLVVYEYLFTCRKIFVNMI